MRWPIRALAVAAVLSVVTVACSDDSGGGAAGDTTTTTVTDTNDPADEAGPAEPVGPEVAGIDFGVLDLPPGDPYEDYTTVQDEFGVIDVQIPEDWSFLITEPVYPWGIDTGRVEDILSWGLQATGQPPKSEFALSDGDGPGTAVRFGSSSSEEEALRGLRQRVERYEFIDGGECDEPVAFDYDDGTHTGLAELWANCGSNDVAELLIGYAVGPAAGAEAWETDLEDYADVRIRLLTDADIDAATRLIESLDFTPVTP